MRVCVCVLCVCVRACVCVHVCGVVMVPVQDNVLPPRQNYPKVSLAYYNLLEVLTLDHIDFLSNLEPEVTPPTLQHVAV